jgi:hypothetical protein
MAVRKAMVWKLFSQHRSIIWTVLAVAVLIGLHEVTGVSKWVLLAPVLLAMFGFMTVWDRFLVRRKNAPAFRP